MTRPILTAAQMRAAEARAIAGGTSEAMLMERAGTALAEAVRRYIGPRETLILCGPGNNGGDGRIAASALQSFGYPVIVASLGDLAQAKPAPILIDCLFGTGLSRGLDASVSQQLISLVDQSIAAVACDLPSGAASDDGSLLSPVGKYDLVVTFGALKPAHRLMPAMSRMGRLVLADIGIETSSDWNEIGRPLLPPLDPAGHKYDRGMVAVLAGAMPGAAALAASAAARSGAGYVRLDGGSPEARVPSSVVQGQAGRLDDPRIGAVLLGPGLGSERTDLIDLAIDSGRPLVLDADALNSLGDPARLKGMDAIITPHEGEFQRLFGEVKGTKPERALEAARISGAVVVLKGADTLVAAPDGRLGFAPPSPPWLASAGTGDVLAGIVAAMRARGLDAFEAASAAVWLHGRAAEIAGPAMIADDLVDALPMVLA